MNTSTSILTPATRGHVLPALAELEERKIPHVVTCTGRVYLEQAALYAQGRESLAIVNAKRAKAGMAPILQYTGRDGKIHSDNDHTVTSCDGVRISEGGKGRSPHQLLTAIDIVPANENGGPIWPGHDDPRWLEIALVMEKHGMEWGGRWTAPWDPDDPHYQFNA